METDQQELVELPWKWEEIAPVLKEVPGADVAKLKRYFEEGPAKQGIHFFVVQYRHGTVIMAKGSTSDYAAIHLQGVVRVRHAQAKQHVTGPGCWHAPRLRRLQNLVLNAPETENSKPAGGFDRFMSSLFLRYPGVILWLIDTNRLRLRAWNGERRAQRLEKYVARVLKGKLGPVRRSERQLARPVSAAEAASASEEGGSPTASAGEPPEFADEKRLTVRDEAGQPLPVDRRFMGLSGALWSQPRSVTLIAEDDPAAGNAPCQMLLIKRKALHELFKSPQGEKFLREQLRKFVGLTLPELLANNQLFRDMLYVDDVQDWERLVAYLRGQLADGSASDVLRQHMTSLFEEDFESWLSAPTTTVNDADRARIVAALNQVLANRSFQPNNPPLSVFSEPAREEALRLLERRSTPTACETCRLNRLLLEVALAPTLKPSMRPWPLFPEEFRRFALDLLEIHERLGLPTLQPEPHEKDETIFREGDSADALYLVLSGMVRVFRTLPGGETAANNLESGSFFGEAAFIDEVVPAPDGQGPPTLMPGRRAAGVKPLCRSYLLRLDRLAFKELAKAEEYEWLSAKFRRERRRVLSHNELFQSGWIIIPRDPPPPIADRLVLTRNILLIDMNRCTRCDQCVQGCAAAHDAQPRFHRSNPELRFGHWEVARACMHCLDAPCMEACPVGAITLLDDNAVQIHRTRCIGCNKCAKECPFGVIDMYDPLTKEDAPSTKKQVANKCDLCLTEDNDPPCVAWCPYDAAQRVDPNDFFSGLKGRADFSDRPPAVVKAANKVEAK